MRRTESRWPRALVIIAGLGILGTLVLGLFGCAHSPTPSTVTVLSDRVGGPASEALEVLTGQEPRAATLPYVGTVIFQPADADDTCLLAHEAQHRTDMADMGAARWVATYLHQLGACERERPRAECLRTIGLEARAYEVQHACQKARTP